MRIPSTPPECNDPDADQLAKQINDFAIESLVRPGNARSRALILPSGAPPQPDGKQLDTPAGAVEPEEISPAMLRELTAELSRQMAKFDQRTGNDAALAAFLGRYADDSSLPGAKPRTTKQNPASTFSAATAAKPTAGPGPRADKAWVSRRFG